MDTSLHYLYNPFEFLQLMIKYKINIFNIWNNMAWIVLICYTFFIINYINIHSQHTLIAFCHKRLITRIFIHHLHNDKVFIIIPI